MIDYEKFKGHTPGPWHVIDLKISAEDPEMPGLPWTVAKVYGDAFYEGGANPTEYNANLIAAAPELIEENKRLREALEACRPYIEDLQSENFEDADACIGLDRDLDNAFVLMQKALATGCEACDAGVICHHHHRHIQDQP